MRKHRRKGRNISGWVILDKPVNMGSTTAVSKIKYLFNALKAGHAGTLDPLASGALPIALGEATKTVPYVMQGHKTYLFTVSWGAATSTDDLEGEIIATSDKRPTLEEIEVVLNDYRGKIQQTPPQFSAIKVNGQRAYDLARGGATVELEPREVEIFDFKIVEANDPNSTSFEIKCSKGTYVRSLARDLGLALGCYGHISFLRRSAVEPFKSSQMISFEQLEAALEMALAADNAENEAQPAQEHEPLNIPSYNNKFSEIDKFIIPTVAALTDLPQITITESSAQYIRHGQPIILTGSNAPSNLLDLCLTFNDKIIAIGDVEEYRFISKRVFL